jgi:hypothetical protein
MALRKVKSRLDFVLQITDYFKGHWEDPGWGRQPANQALIALAIRELAGGMTDAGLQKQINDAADKAIARSAAAVK